MEAIRVECTPGAAAAALLSVAVEEVDSEGVQKEVGAVGLALC